MSSIAAGTTTTTGYVVTSDSTGALVLKTGASATTAVTIDTSQNVTFVGSQTLSGGTANGVLYLNGSKAATSGAALTFDGTAFASTGTGTQSLTVTSSATAAFLQTTGAGVVNTRLQSNITTAQVGTLSNHPFVIQTNSNNIATFDTSGNLGLGVTPSAWAASVWDAIDINQTGCIAGYFNGIESSSNLSLTQNAYEQTDGGGFKYKRTGGGANWYRLANGNFQWYTAPSGTAGNAITFTQAMTLDASGNLGVGTSSPTQRLDVVTATSAGLRVATSTATASTASLFLSVANNFSGASQAYVQCIGPGNSGISQLAFGTAGAAGDTTATERARITSSGQLFVGATSAIIGSPLLYTQGSLSTNGLVSMANNTNTGDVNHGILNLINTATGAAGNDARIMFSFRQVGASSGIDPMASMGAVKEAGDQAAALQFNTRSSAGSFSEKARIDSSGRLTTPFQTFAHAHPPGGFSIPASTDRIVTGTWTSLRNTGSAFNTSNGSFTAPVAGVYSITWSCFFDACASNRLDTYINVNGTTVARQEQQKWGTNSNNSTSFITATVYLNANDGVTFGVFSSSATTVYPVPYPWSYACVYLLG
jgi:hypothetical protein